MRKVTLSKLEIVEIEVLQDQLNNFLSYKNSCIGGMDKNSNGYYDTLLLVDILHRLFFSFRGKIEKSTKNVASLILTVSEAVIILQVCNTSLTIRSDYEKHVMSKTSNLIHEQLININ
jgi:hypothetical protein